VTDERSSDALAGKKAARKRAPRAPTTPGNQVRPRTAEEITTAQTVTLLALHVWAAVAAQKILKRYVGSHGRVD
jgi:hypothetical protein